MSREQSEDAAADLGSCCCCGGTEQVRNIYMINRRCAVSGHGWGCVVCDLPCDGASAVICDTCLANDMPIRFACCGYPATDGRMLYDDLSEPFDHDPTKHAED